MDYILLMVSVAGAFLGMSMTYVIFSSKLKLKEEQLIFMAQEREDLETNLNASQSRFETLR